MASSEDTETTIDPDRDPFPEEIMFEILTRLPVKSLCRFKCVSKHWFSIISDPDFADANFACSQSRSPKLLISVAGDGRRNNFSFRRPGKIGFFSVNYPEQDQSLLATSHGSIDFELAANISSSPSGLICFTCSDGIRVGNPFTVEFDIIQTHVSHTSSVKSFFGFDPIDKNHVILKLEKRNYAPGLCGKSSVFSLTDNQCHDTPPHPWITAGESSVCINGIIYFTAWGDLDAGILGPCLFAFDIRSENFQMIYLPQEPVSDRNYVNEHEHVIDYKGRVALVCDENVFDNSVDEVWMWILEDTEKHTWSFKSFVVPWRENLMRDRISIEGGHHAKDRKAKLFGATHRGELVLATPLSRGSFYLFFYGIDTNTLRRFEVDGFGGRYGPVRLNFVMESLESLIGLSTKKKGRELLRQT